MAELQVLGLAEVVAVDLVGERAMADDGHLAQIGLHVDVGQATQPVAAPQRGSRDAQDLHEVHRPDGHAHQPPVEHRLRCDVEWAVAEEGIGVRVEAERKATVVDRVR